MSIFKFQSFRAKQGYEWSETNTWLKEKSFTLHPVGDPTWNKIEADEIINLPENLWSEYLKVGKGFMDHKGFMPKNPSDDSIKVFKEKVKNFANTYGFDLYVPHGSTLTDLAREGISDTKITPTTVINIADNISALMRFNHLYHESPVIPSTAIKWLNESVIGFHMEFKKTGLEFQTSNIFSSIFISWYQSVLKGNVQKCVICKIPYWAKYSSSETCSGTCRNKKSKGSK
jgi:hypothetical protein